MYSWTTEDELANTTSTDEPETCAEVTDSVDEVPVLRRSNAFYIKPVPDFGHSVERWAWVKIFFDFAVYRRNELYS